MRANSAREVAVKSIARILPHISIVLSGMLIFLFVLDRFNPAMGYLENGGERIVLLALAMSSILTATMLIGYQRRD